MKEIDFNNPQNVKFKDLIMFCEKYFGKPRIKGGHFYFTTQWKGEPYICLQTGKKDKKMAKPYQVRQVKAAFDKYRGENDV